MMQRGVKSMIVAEIFPLHDAAGSQTFPMHFAVGSQISPLHYAAGSQISPLHWCDKAIKNVEVRSSWRLYYEKPKIKTRVPLDCNIFQSPSEVILEQFQRVKLQICSVLRMQFNSCYLNSNSVLV